MVIAACAGSAWALSCAVHVQVIELKVLSVSVDGVPVQQLSETATRDGGFRLEGLGPEWIKAGLYDPQLDSLAQMMIAQEGR